jgi:hypothetical protein
MPKIDRPAKHERASPNDGIEAAFLALANSLRRHAPLTKGSMKPNSAYTTLSALPYHVNGHIRMCGNHDAIDCPGQRGDVRIAADTLNLRGPRVDGKNFVPAVFQPSVDGVGRLTSVPGDTCNADALATKKLGN